MKGQTLISRRTTCLQCDSASVAWSRVPILNLELFLSRGEPLRLLFTRFQAARLDFVLATYNPSDGRLERLGTRRLYGCKEEPISHHAQDLGALEDRKTATRITRRIGTSFGEPEATIG